VEIEHGAHEHLRVGVLEQEPLHADAQRLGDVLVEIERGEHGRDRRIGAGAQRPHRSEPVGARHLHVDQRGVRPVPGNRGQQLIAVRGEADDLHRTARL